MSWDSDWFLSCRNYYGSKWWILSFSWQMITKYLESKFFVTQSLQFQTRISSESPRCRIILLFKSAKDTNVKNAFDLLIINALAIWELSWWFFGWLDVVKSFSIGCDWIFEMSTDSYWMVLKYRNWWIC